MDVARLHDRARAALVSPASIDLLSTFCEDRHRGFSLSALARHTRREVGDVLSAVVALVQAGLVSHDDAPPTGIYRLSGSAAVWRFADSFLRRYNADPSFTAEYLKAVVYNLSHAKTRAA